VKVVLRADVENLGRKGDLLDVSDGYARNFLVPRGLALRASKGAAKQAEAMRRNRAAREERERAAAEEPAGPSIILCATWPANPCSTCRELRI